MFHPGQVMLHVTFLQLPATGQLRRDFIASYPDPRNEIKVTLQEMKEILDAEVIAGNDQLGMDVKEAGSADSLSDVLYFGKAGMLLLTGLTNPLLIQTAYRVGIVAIVIVRGKHPPLETIQLAKELRIPLLSTKYILFETAGRLYMKGIVGIQKVGMKNDLL